MDEETKKVLKELEPLFKKAEEEGLWFYTNYQQLWFSPEQLKEEQKNGKFVWGAVNWHLKDPNEKWSEESKLDNFKRRF